MMVSLGGHARPPSSHSHSHYLELSLDETSSMFLSLHPFPY